MIRMRDKQIEVRDFSHRLPQVTGTTAQIGNFAVLLFVLGENGRDGSTSASEANQRRGDCGSAQGMTKSHFAQRGAAPKPPPIDCG